MDSKLYCLDLNSGRIKWRYFAGQPLAKSSSPVVTAQSLYLFLPGKGIVALDKGAAKASTRPADRASERAAASSPLVRTPRWVVANATQFLAEDEQYVYLARRDNAIMAVDRNTGAVKFTSRRKDFAFFVSNPDDATVFAATRDGRIYAIEAVLKPGAVGEMAWVD